MILTREQFIAWWDSWVPENTADRLDHPLWQPETDLKPGPPSLWFVCASCQRTSKDNYWDWCNSNLRGLVRCYMLDEEADEEWWGFTNRDDITWWMLKWA